MSLAGRSVLVVAIILASTAVAVSTALGQGEETTTTATPVVADDESGAANGDDDAEEAENANDDNTAEIVAAFVFGFFVILAFLAYLYLVQDRFFDTADRALARLGTTPRLESVAALADRSVHKLVPEEGARLTITGAAVIAVGEKGAATYSILAADGGEVPAWSVNPDDIASVEPASGDSVKVTAKKAGVFILNVERGPSKGSAPVTAIDLSGTSALPFVGAGYGTVLIAIALLTVAAVLGMEDILSGEALATLFGALAGYIFLKSASTTGGEASENKEPDNA